VIRCGPALAEGAEVSNHLLAALGDGRLAVGQADGTVQVWDCAKGQLLHVLGADGSKHATAVRAVAADGGLLVSAGEQDVRVWQLIGAPGGPLTTQQAHPQAAVAQEPAAPEPAVPNQGWQLPASGAQVDQPAPEPPALITLFNTTNMLFGIKQVALSARHSLCFLLSNEFIAVHSTRDGRWLRSIDNRMNSSLVVDAPRGLLLLPSCSSWFMADQFSQFIVQVAAHSLDTWQSVKLVAPPVNLQHDPPAEGFLWDKPLVACATGGLLFVKCMQFSSPSLAGARRLRLFEYVSALRRAGLIGQDGPLHSSVRSDPRSAQAADAEEKPAVIVEVQPEVLKSPDMYNSMSQQKIEDYRSRPASCMAMLATPRSLLLSLDVTAEDTKHGNVVHVAIPYTGRRSMQPQLAYAHLVDKAAP